MSLLGKFLAFQRKNRCFIVTLLDSGRPFVSSRVRIKGWSSGLDKYALTIITIMLSDTDTNILSQ
jgi:hypothetical protein